MLAQEWKSLNCDYTTQSCLFSMRGGGPSLEEPATALSFSPASDPPFHHTANIQLNRKQASKEQTSSPPPKFHSLCCHWSWVVIELCGPAGPGKWKHPPKPAGVVLCAWEIGPAPQEGLAVAMAPWHRAHSLWMSPGSVTKVVYESKVSWSYRRKWWPHLGRLWERRMKRHRGWHASPSVC